MINYLDLASKRLGVTTPALCEVQWEFEGVTQHLYLCNDKNSIWWDGVDGSNSVEGVGNEYIPTYIDITLPDQGNATGAKIILSNVNLEIIRILRELDESPRFIINATVIQNPFGSPIINKLVGLTMTLSSITVTAGTISATLNTGLQGDLSFPREIGNQKIIPALR